MAGYACAVPSICMVGQGHGTLPIPTTGGGEEIDNTVCTKLQTLEVKRDMFQQLHLHDTFYLLSMMCLHPVYLNLFSWSLQK